MISRIKDRDLVRLYLRVDRYNDKALVSGLGDEHAVERITMIRWKPAC
jgi:hypothetical protein